MTNLRLFASRIIHEVTEGRSLSDCLDAALPTLKETRDRAFVQALCYGVCRYYARLDVILSHLLTKPMKAKDSDLHALIIVGLYQLMEMRVPDYAAVTETVKAADSLKKSWGRGLVNAVLRGYLRERASMEEKIASDEESEYAHPAWWIAAIKKAWPNEWQAVLRANNQHPPFALRVNQQKKTRDDYLHLLASKQLQADSLPETQSGILLHSPITVEALPGFLEGEVSVQDGAAQLAAEIMVLKPGQRVLDACAAPGGKLTHLVECEPHLGKVVAIERDAKRMQAIQENLARLQVEATCFCQDAADVQAWWDGILFDRILLDAPCSASGVIRRHPDIKLLRQPQDVKAFAQQQLHLLTSLWPLLKPGGLLVYATCSLFPEENTEVMQAFLQSHEEAQEEKLDVLWGLPCTIGRQILPGMHHMDGFYYARVRKVKRVAL
jgi:16S rRNA (cytosine967-C5)-methyltransferase